MSFIFVYSWKPANAINFGDEIGPMIVQALCRKAGINIDVTPTVSPSHPKILAVGSVLHEARGSDVVWGAGVNSKHRSLLPKDSNIRFNAVRGPLTRSMMLDQGFDCPEVYGDPGLLFPMLFDKEIRMRRGELERAAKKLGMNMPETVIIPNINDDRFLPYFATPDVDQNVMVVRPNFSPITVAAYISAAKRVISSSLHGLVFADVYGRSVTRMTSQYEPEFKYSDYYEGTGRLAPRSYPDLKSSLDGEETAPLAWDPGPLLAAFPLSDAEQIKRLTVKIFDMELNTRYQVSDLKEGDSPFTHGWASPEGGSVWSVNEWMDLGFHVKETLPQGAKLRVNMGTLKKGIGGFALLRVVHKGAAIASIRVGRDEPGKLFDLPLPEPEKNGEISLRFKVENASRPVDHGLGSDARSLGVWISSLEVIP